MTDADLLAKAQLIRELGAKLQTVLGMKDKCTPASSGVQVLSAHLRDDGLRAPFDETNHRALLSICLQDGLTAEAVRIRDEMRQVALSMSDAVTGAGDRVEVQAEAARREQVER